MTRQKRFLAKEQRAQRKTKQFLAILASLRLGEKRSFLPGAVPLLALGLLLSGPLAVAVAQEEEKSAKVEDRFPEAEGKETVVSTCTVCHSLVRVAANHNDSTAWGREVKIHEGRGLKLDQEEAEAIVNYLSAYFGPLVNINSAGAAEWAALPEVDKKLAEAIVRQRQKNGAFKKPEDLTGVEGFSPELLAKLRNRITTGSEEGQGAKTKK